MLYYEFTLNIFEIATQAVELFVVPVICYFCLLIRNKQVKRDSNKNVPSPLYQSKERYLPVLSICVQKGNTNKKSGEGIYSIFGHMK